MKVETIMADIDFKLYEIHVLFPETLGSGNDTEMSTECSNARGHLIELRLSINRILKIMEKNKKRKQKLSKKPIDID